MSGTTFDDKLIDYMVSSVFNFIQSST